MKINNYLIALVVCFLLNAGMVEAITVDQRRIDRFTASDLKIFIQTQVNKSVKVDFTSPVVKEAARNKLGLTPEEFEELLNLPPPGRPGVVGKRASQFQQQIQELQEQLDRLIKENQDLKVVRDELDKLRKSGAAEKELEAIGKRLKQEQEARVAKEEQEKKVKEEAEVQRKAEAVAAVVEYIEPVLPPLLNADVVAVTVEQQKESDELFIGALKELAGFVFTGFKINDAAQKVYVGVEAYKNPKTPSLPLPQFSNNFDAYVYAIKDYLTFVGIDDRFKKRGELNKLLGYPAAKITKAHKDLVQDKRFFEDLKGVIAQNKFVFIDVPAILQEVVSKKAQIAPAIAENVFKKLLQPVGGTLGGFIFDNLDLANSGKNLDALYNVFKGGVGANNILKTLKTIIVPCIYDKSRLDAAISELETIAINILVSQREIQVDPRTNMPAEDSVAGVKQILSDAQVVNIIEQLVAAIKPYPGPVLDKDYVIWLFNQFNALRLDPKFYKFSGMLSVKKAEDVAGTVMTAEQKFAAEVLGRATGAQSILEVLRNASFGLQAASVISVISKQMCFDTEVLKEKFPPRVVQVEVKFLDSPSIFKDELVDDLKLEIDKIIDDHANRLYAKMEDVNIFFALWNDLWSAKNAQDILDIISSLKKQPDRFVSKQIKDNVDLIKKELAKLAFNSDNVMQLMRDIVGDPEKIPHKEISKLNDKLKRDVSGESDAEKVRLWNQAFADLLNNFWIHIKELIDQHKESPEKENARSVGKIIKGAIDEYEKTGKRVGGKLYKDLKDYSEVLNQKVKNLQGQLVQLRNNNTPDNQIEKVEKNLKSYIDLSKKVTSMLTRFKSGNRTPNTIYSALENAIGGSGYMVEFIANKTKFWLMIEPYGVLLQLLDSMFENDLMTSKDPKELSEGLEKLNQILIGMNEGQVIGTIFSQIGLSSELLVKAGIYKDYLQMPANIPLEQRVDLLDSMKDYNVTNAMKAIIKIVERAGVEYEKNAQFKNKIKGYQAHFMAVMQKVLVWQLESLDTVSGEYIISKELSLNDAATKGRNATMYAGLENLFSPLIAIIKSDGSSTINQFKKLNVKDIDDAIKQATDKVIKALSSPDIPWIGATQNEKGVERQNIQKIFTDYLNDVGAKFKNLVFSAKTPPMVSAAPVPGGIPPMPGGLGGPPPPPAMP